MRGFGAWLGRHRGLIGFAAGALVTALAVAVIVYLVVADQRRSAWIVSATLSQALAREIRIERVTELGPSRIVMRGVTLPREGGWPADITAESVEATGSLTAAARGQAAPVRVVVTRPTVTAPGGASGAGGFDLGAVRQALATALTNPLVLEVALVGGRARQGDVAAEFDLVLRKGAGEAKGELVVRQARGAPFALTVDARREGEDAARLALEGRGALAPLAAWLPGTGLAALGDRTTTLVVDVGLSSAERLTARGRLAVDGVLTVAGEAVLDGGALRLTVPRATADLTALARAARLPWTPSGHAEIGDATATWRPGSDRAPTVRAVVRVEGLSLPAMAVGTDVAADAVEGAVTLEPAGEGLALHGELRVPRLRLKEFGGLEAAPIEARYRVTLDGGGTPTRADLEQVRLRIDGAMLQGRVAYDLVTRRVDADLAGEAVDAADLTRRLAPGWLAPEDRLRASGLTLSARALGVPALEGGTARLEARALRLERADGHVTAGRTTAGLALGPGVLDVTVDTVAVAGSLAGLPGEIPRLGATATLSRGGDGALRVGTARLAAQDAEGRDLALAEVRPASRTGWLALSARAPALARLDRFWPTLPRRLSGSARLDVEVGGPGFREVDGRFALDVADGELLGGQVSFRGLAADIPVRRGADVLGEPPWGTVVIGEVIAYGGVVHDLSTPARAWRDRLSLNDLSYVLYSGEGKGWGEIEIEPGGPRVRGRLTGEGIRIEEFMTAYGIRGGTMTGLLRYELDYQYRAGRLGLKGRFDVPEGGTVNIEILDRLLSYADADPTGIVRKALANLRVFDYKSAEAEVYSGADDVRVSMSLKGRERFGLFPSRVPEINVLNLPIGFLGRQFPGS
jgi:hypothetical protein